MITCKIKKGLLQNLFFWRLMKFGVQSLSVLELFCWLLFSWKVSACMAVTLIRTAPHDLIVNEIIILIEALDRNGWVCDLFYLNQPMKPAFFRDLFALTNLSISLMDSCTQASLIWTSWVKKCVRCVNIFLYLKYWCRIFW